jgi:hypothetical protein
VDDLVITLFASAEDSTEAMPEKCDSGLFLALPGRFETLAGRFLDNFLDNFP